MKTERKKRKAKVKLTARQRLMKIAAILDGIGIRDGYNDTECPTWIYFATFIELREIYQLAKGTK